MGPYFGAVCRAAGPLQQEPDGGGKVEAGMHLLRRDALRGEQEAGRLSVAPADAGQCPRGVGVVEDLPHTGRDRRRVGAPGLAEMSGTITRLTAPIVERCRQLSIEIDVASRTEGECAVCADPVTVNVSRVVVKSGTAKARTV